MPRPLVALGGILLSCSILASCQYTPGTLTDIRGISQDKGASYLASQGASITSPAPASSFVQRVGAGLQLGGVPYDYNGFNNYYMLQKSLANSTRQEVTDVLVLAQSLNLTVMRSWAFTDGSDQYAPIQPQQGMLDSKALSEGLDYFVAQAEQYGIKLILTLTNYFADYGGAQQYVEWNDNSNASTITQFYQDNTIQSQYNDYITAIVLRKNTITGRLYRDDPNIFAWDIINEPANPGDSGGDVLYTWLSQTSAYLKSIDPNHLVYYGTPAYFGASTPSLINLDGNYSGQYSPYRGYPYYPGCQGEDWVRNLGIKTIDLASYHIYPNAGPYEMQITQSQIQAHLSQASAAGKPLIFDEFNRKRPVSARNNFLQMVYSMGSAAGSPVVGYNVWMPASSTYPDYDGFEIYGNQAGQSQAIPAGPNVTADFAILLARRSIFRNFVAADTCVNNYVQATDYVDGYQETLSIIQNQG